MKNFKFNIHGFKPTMVWGKVPLFDAKDAVAFLIECEKLDVGILGVEGFRVLDGKRVPDMNYILDFSELVGLDGGRERSFGVAREFICSCGDADLLFEFVLDDE